MKNLATLRPDLAAEWNIEKNGTDSPSNYTCGSGAKRWWRCSKGHEWQATIYNRTAGRGCPYCAGKLPVQGVNDLATLRPDLAAEWNMEKNGTDSPSNYTCGSGARRWWKCSKGHEWQATILHRTHGKGCPVCNGRRTGVDNNSLLSDYPDIAAKWDYDRNASRPEDYRPHSSQIVWWKCLEGHTWSARICEMTHPRRLGSCPYCSGHRPVRGRTDLASLRPDLAVEWDYEKNKKEPEDYTLYSNAKVFWKCPGGHSYRRVIASRAKGRGCPICYREKTMKS